VRFLAPLRSFAALAALTFLPASSTRAADAPGSSPAQDATAPAAATSLPAPAPAAVHLEAPTFLFSRYSTVSSSSFYAVCGLGRASLVLGVVDNPHTGYREVIGGGLSQLAWGQQAIAVALAGAAASDSKYLQVYVLPSFILGRLRLSGAIEWYQPLERAGVHQLDVNPMTLLVPLTSRLALGAFSTLGVTAGAPLRLRAGPVLQLGIASSALRLECARNVSGSSSELRMTAQVGF
jgi:hypothetical protein